MIYSPSKTLTKHFKMYEVAKSYVASRLGVDNTPSEDALDKAYELAINILEPIREHYGVPFSPSSWYRSEELERIIANSGFTRWCSKHNKPISSSSWAEYFSKKSHPRGEAADIEILGVANDDLWSWVRDNIPHYDQLIREFPKVGDPMSGWVHVSFNTNNNRKQVFTI